MIASDEIIVPQAGHAISDSPPAAGSAWTTTFATGFATCTTATGIWAAGFAATGAGLAGTGWGRSPAWGAGGVGATFTETAGTEAGAPAIGRIDPSWASSGLAPARSRVASSARFARAA